jgi:transposase
LEIRPQAGKCWAPIKRPQRLPATYTSPYGIRQLLAGYDLKTDKLFGIIRRHKRWKEFLNFLKIIRRRYLYERRLIIIFDDFSPHKNQKVFQWCRINSVWLIFTATNASWMNRIEAHFGSVHYFLLKNSYPTNYEQLEQNIKEHLKWQNKNHHD